MCGGGKREVCVRDIDRREGEGELNDIYWLPQLYLQCHGHL